MAELYARACPRLVGPAVGALAAVLAVSGTTMLGHRTIRGHDGVLFESGPSFRCVRWRESSDAAVAICSNAPPNGAALGADELLRIAASLR